MVRRRPRTTQAQATMVRVPTVHVPATRRMILGAIVPLLAVALMGLLMPSAAAAPAAPYFGPATIVDGPPAYWAAEPSLAVGSNRIAYLAFTGWGGAVTQSDIFFTKSSDGRTWSVPVRVNNDAGGASQSEPALALDSANAIYIAWTDTRNGNNDVFFSKSTDGGLSFSANVRVNDVTTNSQSEPALAVDPVNPHLGHVVWPDFRNANTQPDIYATRSTNAGASFAANVKVNDDLGAVTQWGPSLAANGGKIVTVWADARTSGSTSWDIYDSSSTDGLTWSANMK